MSPEELNKILFHTVTWPAIVYTAIFMVAGALGNGLVLYVYRMDFHKSVPWIFIYFLSALDMCACLISLPTEIYLFVNYANFPSPIWCKISRYVSFIFYEGTCVALMVIALSRYDKICRSSKAWFNIQRAKKSCVGVLLFSMLHNIPALVMYGDYHIPIAVLNDTVKIVGLEDIKRYKAYRNNTEYNSSIPIPLVVFAKTCSVSSEYSKTTLTTVFFYTQFFLFVIMVLLIAFFYAKVTRKLVNHRQRQENSFKLYMKDDEESENQRLRSSSKSKGSISNKSPVKLGAIEENEVSAGAMLSDDVFENKNNSEADDLDEGTTDQMDNANTHHKKTNKTLPISGNNDNMANAQDIDEAGGNNRGSSKSRVILPSGFKGKQTDNAVRDRTDSIMSTPIPDTPRTPRYHRNRDDSLISPSTWTLRYNRRMSVAPIKAARTSGTLLGISLGFTFSFLPCYVILIVWRSFIGDEFVFSMNMTELALLNIGVRSSTVSNAINPILYGVLNHDFRRRCKALCKLCKLC